MKQFETQVIVAGAGIAGLAAARILAEAGLHVLLVEARDGVGGRIMTHRAAHAHKDHYAIDGEVIELGAEFVHGRPPDLLALIREAGLHLVETEGINYCAAQEGATGKTIVHPCTESTSFQILDDLGRHTGQDMNFAAWLRQAKCPEDVARETTRFVEGFNAADAERISIRALAEQQAAEDAIEGERSAHLVEGYSALAHYVHQRFTAAGGRTELKALLKHVRWKPGQVEIIVENSGRELGRVDAEQLVVALPLGVLQANTVVFDPIPPVFNSLRSLAMGPVLRLVLVFNERFWLARANPCKDLSFLFTPGHTPGVWWSRSLTGTPVLTAWIGGPRAEQIAPGSFLEYAMTTLHEVFDISEAEIRSMLLASYLHDWNSDPLSMGAYSYVCEGGLPASRRLSAPADNTLYFAGEHTDTTGHWGTVHGALRSGVRAAGQLLASRATHTTPRT